MNIFDRSNVINLFVYMLYYFLKNLDVNYIKKTLET